MRLFNRCSGQLFHKWIQVEENGVYSRRQVRILEETDYGYLSQDYDTLTFKCARCGKMGYVHHTFPSHWWLKNPTAPKRESVP